MSFPPQDAGAPVNCTITGSLAPRYLNHKKWCKWYYIHIEDMVEVGRYDIVKILVEQYGINLYHEAIEIASDRDDSHDFLAWTMLHLEKKRYRCGCGAFWPRMTWHYIKQ